MHFGANSAAFISVFFTAQGRSFSVSEDNAAFSLYGARKAFLSKCVQFIYSA